MIQNKDLYAQNLVLKPYMSMEAAARSKAWVCGRSLAGIVGSNAAGGMDVCCVLSGVGLCDGRIARPEESYRVWCAWKWSWSLEKGLTHEGLLRNGHISTERWTFMSTAHFTFDLLINTNQILAIFNRSPPHQIYNRPTDIASATTRNSPALMTRWLGYILNDNFSTSQEKRDGKTTTNAK